jgi:hypothetical protein
MITFLLCVFVISAMTIIALAWNSPNGWEDDEGFHEEIDG